MKGRGGRGNRGIAEEAKGKKRGNKGRAEDVKGRKRKYGKRRRSEWKKEEI